MAGELPNRRKVPPVNNFEFLLGTRDSVSRPVADDNAVVGNAVEANTDATSSLVILSFPKRPVTVSTTQSSRGPPAVIHAAISHRKFRDAA